MQQAPKRHLGGRVQFMTGAILFYWNEIAIFIFFNKNYTITTHPGIITKDNDRVVMPCKMLQPCNKHIYTHTLTSLYTCLYLPQFSSSLPSRQWAVPSHTSPSEMQDPSSIQTKPPSQDTSTNKDIGNEYIPLMRSWTV